MVDTTLIREHMPVVARDGRRVGEVDHLDAGRIKLTRAGSPDGHHHYLPLSEISSVDEAVVTSQLTFEEIEKMFRRGEDGRGTEG